MTRNQETQSAGLVGMPHHSEQGIVQVTTKKARLRNSTVEEQHDRPHRRLRYALCSGHEHDKLVTCWRWWNEACSVCEMVAGKLNSYVRVPWVLVVQIAFGT